MKLVGHPDASSTLKIQSWQTDAKAAAKSKKTKHGKSEGVHVFVRILACVSNSTILRNKNPASDEASLCTVGVLRQCAFDFSICNSGNNLVLGSLEGEGASTAGLANQIDVVTGFLAFRWGNVNTIVVTNRHVETRTKKIEDHG